jgi:hypothetical protein
VSCWSPVSGSFHDTNQFGRLTFSQTQASTRQESGRTQQAITVRLDIDWKALGLDPAKAKLTAPRIEYFQDSAEFLPKGEIPMESGKGWLLTLHE